MYTWPLMRLSYTTELITQRNSFRQPCLHGCPRSAALLSSSAKYVIECTVSTSKSRRWSWLVLLDIPGGALTFTSSVLVLMEKPASQGCDRNFLFPKTMLGKLKIRSLHVLANAHRKKKSTYTLDHGTIRQKSKHS